MLNLIFRVLGILLILGAIALVAKKSFNSAGTSVQGVKKVPLNKKLEHWGDLIGNDLATCLVIDLVTVIFLRVMGGGDHDSSCRA